MTTSLHTGLEPATRAWLDHALAAAAHDPEPALELRFAEAGRRCGPAAPAEVVDAVRVLLLCTARAGADTLARLYWRGTAAERRAVLAALPRLLPGPEAVALTEDALRTNDPRLVAAAVGPYAGEHLDAHGWRHAILKCLFIGVPVAAVADLHVRARGDAELARMLDDFAAERCSAGRPVPGDLHCVRTLALADAAPSRKES
ncbi:EboA domain-containing protein [Streptomyces luteolus]|uniref:EboA domain-containing protein n=1 Tax=Streptomyces luteolus TaxID=3043615 RepID=A0ABT6T706_9ACTN|nr:EboA domain-containing protein [Streptomyces sp. B-S-A12]MDI3423678.1 EboA domain-containing protein [Streptomyces sp. B-S-A12]